MTRTTSVLRPGTPSRRHLRSAVVAAVLTVAMSTAATNALAQPVTPAADPLVATTPCTSSARACVDLADHTAWLIDNGEIVRGPVSVMDGLEDETPLGTYAVEWKTEQWTSREFGTPMPFAVFFAPGGIAFHEGRQDTPSAGCVKLTKEDAPAFFSALNVGDEVQIR